MEGSKDTVLYRLRRETLVYRQFNVCEAWSGDKTHAVGLGEFVRCSGRTAIGGTDPLMSTIPAIRLV